VAAAEGSQPRKKGKRDGKKKEERMFTKQLLQTADERSESYTFSNCRSTLLGGFYKKYIKYNKQSFL
jgi:hypothetical protein